MIKVTRKSTESEMTVIISEGPVKPDYRNKIKTPLPFLSHMIEHVVWRSGLNIETEVNLTNFNLTHLVCEDLGIALGKAIAAYVQKNTDSGIYGFGDGIGMIDEARAFCALSFESRTYFNMKYDFMPDNTEGMNSEDLETFLEGIAQGANMTIHLELQCGHNGHHVWEAIYRAFGFALGKAIQPHAERAGMTSGVAGSITYEIEEI